VGEEMTPADITHHRPFNSPIETGLRALFVLDVTAPEKSDLQRLIVYDYLLVHSADPEGGPPSLHAAVPHRSAEWMVRRELLTSGLDLMFTKELLDKSFGKSGIQYAASELTHPFLGHLQSPYANRLRDLASWVSASFRSYSDEDLLQYMIKHLGRWGAEFNRESVLRRVNL
jgi:hypothetical protein